MQLPITSLEPEPPTKRPDTRGGVRPGSGGVINQKLARMKELNFRRWGTPAAPTTTIARGQWNADRRAKLRMMSMLAHLRDDESEAAKGLTWSSEVCVMLLQVVFQTMLTFQVSKTAACNFAAKTGRSSSRILKLVNEYMEHGTVAQASGATPLIRGPQPSAELSGEQQQSIMERIRRWTEEEGVAVTMRLIQMHIKQEYDLLLSLTRLRRYLVVEWKCPFLRGREVPPLDPVKHRLRIGQFIMIYNRALQAVAAGTHVIVYSDESYIHDNHAVQFVVICELYEPTALVSE